MRGTYLTARLLGVDGDQTVPLRSSRAPHYAYTDTRLTILGLYLEPDCKATDI